MSVSRRRFLKHGAFAAVACAAAPLQAFSGRRTTDGESPAEIGRLAAQHHLSVNRSAFEGLVGSPFKVSPTSGSSAPVWLRLASVTELPAIAPVNPGSLSVASKHVSSAPTTSGYILSFSGPGTSLTQETYAFENDRLGRFPLFIVPGGPGQYVAVFNLLDAPVLLSPPAPARDGGPTTNGAAASAPGAAAPNGGASATPSVNKSSSPSGRPAQEQLEPMFGDRIKTQIPE
jgi:hypothetical protein